MKTFRVNQRSLIVFQGGMFPWLGIDGNVIGMCSVRGVRFMTTTSIVFCVSDMAI
jgi:hypothetical protein